MKCAACPLPAKARFRGETPYCGGHLSQMYRWGEIRPRIQRAIWRGMLCSTCREREAVCHGECRRCYSRAWMRNRRAREWQPTTDESRALLAEVMSRRRRDASGRWRIA